MNAMHDDDDALRRALAEPGPHVDDDGFTDRVITRLPPPRRRGGTRIALLTGSVALGAAALWLSPVLPFLDDTLNRAAAPGGAPQAALLASVALVAALVWTGAYAFRPD